MEKMKKEKIEELAEFFFDSYGSEIENMLGIYCFEEVIKDLIKSQLSEEEIDKLYNNLIKSEE